MSIQINLDALLKRFGRPVLYNSEQEIQGIYDKQVVDAGGVDTIAEILKIKKVDLPDLDKGDTFEFIVDDIDKEYKAKSFDEERSGFVFIVLELQP